MKLNSIAEGYILQNLRNQLKNSGYFDRPLIKTDNLYNPSRGFTSDSSTSGMNIYTSGIPRSNRLRSYLGLSNRPGSIKL